MDALEEQRRSTDVLYAMFAESDSDTTRRVTLKCFQVIEKKYGNALKDCRMVQEGVKLLGGDFCDGDGRLFVFLQMLSHDSAIQAFVRGSYKPGNLWGTKEEASAHLDAFLGELQIMTHRLLTWHSITELNVAKTVREFVDVAEEKYMSTYH